MQFICETCRANLQIADEKLRGKRLIVRCKRCGVQIRIADPALAAPPQPAISGAQAAPRTAAPPPPLQAFASEPAVWFAVVRGAQSGPLTRSELETRVTAGEIHPGTYVWKVGTDAWVRAHTERELVALFPSAPPAPVHDPMPAAAPSTPAEGSVPTLAASAPSEPAGPARPKPTRTPAPRIPPGDAALDLARWGVDELSRPRTDTPLPALTPSISRPEFRVGQPPRRGPLRAALIVLGVAGVASLAAFAIFYEHRESSRSAQELAQSGSPQPGATDSPKVAEQNLGKAAAPDPAGRAAVPSPEVLKKKVDESMPALQGCVDQALQREPALRVGKILILTTVAPSGEVTSTRIDKKNVDQSQLGACLKSAAKNIHFPSFSGEAFPLDIPIVVAGGD